MSNDGATDESLHAFHPAVAGWFRRRFGVATDVQDRAWRLALGRQHVLVAAPTGSGKTLAAFMAAIDALIKEGLERGLRDEVHILYVSPLKALSNDIEVNLREPLAGIREELAALGRPDVEVRAAVRTGDTTASERARMRKSPPHILVTTPESLYILLTSESGREMLRSTRSVIVDELHAIAGSKRGAHLMLTLERLQALCASPPVRIGLSATVKPVEDIARYLVGNRDEPVSIVDAGHVRQRDLKLELPRSPLSAVMANEVWEEIYDRLAELVREHRTTLVFVNQRRVAERAARHLAERIGEEHVAAHHGSLAREHRLEAEQRLKNGQLRALIATSSLELGIDIGDVDLVIQLGSPRAIGPFLQRVGRSGHSLGATPKGRLFPLSLDDLIECIALLDSVRRGELERIRIPSAPLDVLAQQLVAETACREWGVEQLHAAFCQAAPYASLPLAKFEQVVQTLAEGYSTRRGRRGAYLHYDAVNRRLRGRRSARLTAVMNAGVIPDQFDYEVVLSPEEHRVGTLHEDFAFESLPGDIFQLGNTSYRILKVVTGKVYVEDAKGQPPNMPFWLGEGLSRSDELSASVARFTAEFAARIVAGPAACQAWLETSFVLEPAAARQAVEFLAAARAVLGALPGPDTVIMERFFDEVGDTHLVIHSPFGARLNRAWGLALRKRFCRKFNFELQASALDDSIVLSFGPTHSFPLTDVTHYLRSASVRELLVQALLDAPMFATRWRWNASIALAVQRMRNGKRLPPPFQRADSEDLLSLVFPDQLACAENLTGEREVPDHPLVEQTISDCLHETMDIDGLERLLLRMERGELEVICRDVAEPSTLSHAVLNARPYAFLDDGDAEGRRTRSVAMASSSELPTVPAFGGISREAIEQVKDETWPEIDHADEMHDALVVFGFLTAAEIASHERELNKPAPALAGYLATLALDRRAARIEIAGGGDVFIAAERLHEVRSLYPSVPTSPPIQATTASVPPREDALRELVRSRLELLGPVSAESLAASFGIGLGEIRSALAALEGEGAVMQGSFTGPEREEWCERRLLARMYRYSRDHKRATVRAVPVAQFLRFLFRWQGIAGVDGKRAGEEGLLAALRQLEGCVAPAAAWEDELLPARVERYLPSMLDKLCAAGRIVWHRPARLQADVGPGSGPVRATPILLAECSALAHWQSDVGFDLLSAAVSPRAQQVIDQLRLRGASFASDLQQSTGMIRTELEAALGELVSRGLVHCDSFAGLRALTRPTAPTGRRRRTRRAVSHGTLEDAGRWVLTIQNHAASAVPGALAAPRIEHVARVLLRRYGVVFRKLLEREAGLPPWRELFYVYRRLEARGEVEGGRFVSGFSGEQFALAAAATSLRKQMPTEPIERVALSAVDPLNLIGTLTAGGKVPRLRANRVLFENGVPAAVYRSRQTRHLESAPAGSAWDRQLLLVRKPQAISPKL